MLYMVNLYSPVSATLYTSLFPVDGVWAGWSPWTPCNVTCGMGYQSRVRSCNNPKQGGAPCMGDGVDTRKCPHDDSQIVVCPGEGICRMMTQL